MKARGSRSGFTLIELLVVISVIIILATIAITALAGVMGQQQVKNANATLKIIDSAVSSYHKLYGRWPVDLNFSPPAQSEATVNGYTTQLNKNILKNLKKDWGQGNFNAFPPESIRIDSGIDLSDGLEYFADPWGRPYQFKIKEYTKSGKKQIQVIYYYSPGEDGQDDFADLQSWLTLGGSWPPGDKYQIDLQTTNPGSVNNDNIYLSAE